MAFPRKYKHLLEVELKDVEVPDYVWVTYAVCACTKDGCGWGGWILEAALKKTEKRYGTVTGDKPLPQTEYVCPECGRTLFRTSASVRMEPSADQTEPWIEGVNFESTGPMEYED